MRFLTVSNNHQSLKAVRTRTVPHNINSRLARGLVAMALKIVNITHYQIKYECCWGCLSTVTEESVTSCQSYCTILTNAFCQYVLGKYRDIHFGML